VAKLLEMSCNFLVGGFLGKFSNNFSQKSKELKGLVAIFKLSALMRIEKVVEAFSRRKS